MKTFLLTLILLSGVTGFSQQSDTLVGSRSGIADDVRFDSVKVKVKVLIDSLGNVIDVNYLSSSSKSSTSKMVEIARKQALKMKYTAHGELYSQIVTFHFVVVN